MIDDPAQILLHRRRIQTGQLAEHLVIKDIFDRGHIVQNVDDRKVRSVHLVLAV